jgi:hypothetical protein
MATLEERLYNAGKAREILDNEQFHAAFDEIEQEWTRSWKESPARDVEGREKLYLMLHCLEKVRGMLVSRLETGKLARLELDHLEAKQHADSYPQET